MTNFINIIIVIFWMRNMSKDDVKIRRTFALPAGISADANRHDILRLELERRTALISRDIERLDDLLADDLVHIHGNGKVEGKAEYLEGIRTKYRFHSVNRSGLKIRIYGSVAVLTGAILQVFSLTANDRKFETEGFLTQIWLRKDAVWRQNTYHMQFLKVDGRPIV